MPAPGFGGIAEALVIRPGDHLIVRTRTSLSADEAELLKDALVAKLPDLASVVILVGVEQIAVMRND